MLKIILPFFFLTASTYAGDCWQIKDKDTKALCQATTEGKQTCWQIKNKDQKAYCEAVAYGKTTCWQIKSKDKKAMCKAQTGQ